MRDSGSRLGAKFLLTSVFGTGVLLVGLAGCRSQQPGMVAINNSGFDPADANLAQVSGVSDGGIPVSGGMYPPVRGSQRLLEINGRGFDSRGVSGTGRVLGARMTNASQQQAVEYPQNVAQNDAPIERRRTQGVPAPDASYSRQDDPGSGYATAGYPSQTNPNDGYANDSQEYGRQSYPADGGYGRSSAPQQDAGQWSDGEDEAYNQVTEQADTPPPPLPVYDQPPAPAPNYLWTPGYWSYAPGGYYWVPGAWIAAPYTGALWTPGYWSVWHHRYGYHPGYWGRHIGFYGGVVYGFGYYGSGYHGGYWRGNDFCYNEAVNRVNVLNVRNVYNRSVIVNNTVINNTIVNNQNVTLNRVSYNGGTGGVQARPAPAEIAAYRGPRVPAMTSQLLNQRSAAQNRQQFFRENGGRPAVPAAPRPFAADRVAAPAVVRTALDTPRGGVAVSQPLGGCHSLGWFGRGCRARCGRGSTSRGLFRDRIRKGSGCWTCSSARSRPRFPGRAGSPRGSVSRRSNASRSFNSIRSCSVSRA